MVRNLSTSLAADRMCHILPPQEGGKLRYTGWGEPANIAVKASVYAEPVCPDFCRCNRRLSFALRGSVSKTNLAAPS